jgi:hypothetical protein
MANNPPFAHLFFRNWPNRRAKCGREGKVADRKKRTKEQNGRTEEDFEVEWRKWEGGRESNDEHTKKKEWLLLLDLAPPNG